MTNITPLGIINHSISEVEFNLLKYIDSRLFIKSATERFTEWDNSFDSSHPDWPLRVQVQNALALSLESAIKKKHDELKNLSSIKVIYLGASLGSISSYFTLSILKKYNFLEKTEIYILDLLDEPLERTKAGIFTFPDEAVQDCGYADIFSVADYKKALSKSHIARGVVTDIPFELKDFDITIAPFIHHHLNYQDKQIACKEMERLSKLGGLLFVGDLTFTYPEFSDWLKKHSEESVPYALESFIPLDEHIGFFKNSKPLIKEKGDFFYTFCVEKEKV